MKRIVHLIIFFDNDPSTLWSSYHDPYTDVKWFDGEQKYAFKVDKLYYGAKTPDYPYSLVVQPEMWE